jgi:hypothetical protein
VESKIKFLFTLFGVLVFAGCIRRQAFYVSPYNGLNNSYHTIPLRSDSVKSSLYINSVIFTGSANDYSHDHKFAFQTSLSRGQNFGHLQAYYGVGITLGNYNVKSFDSLGTSSSVNYKIINQFAGSKFFGTGGVEAGLNIVVPVGFSEWRVLGIETSMQQEFGEYLKFREQLPDSAATLIVRNSFLATLGGYSEITAETKHGSVGFKLAIGTLLGSGYHHLQINDSNYSYDRLVYQYFNLTFQLTSRKWTGYLQTNFATKSGNALFGANYRLGK